MDSSSRLTPADGHTPANESIQVGSSALAERGRRAVRDRLARRVATGENLRADHDRVITAEHEAAHVVAYLVTGCGFHLSQISPLPLTQAAPGPVRRDIFTIAIVSIAGQVVEDAAHEYLGRPIPPLVERVAEAVEWVESGEDAEELGDWSVFAVSPALAEVAYAQAALMLERFADAHAEIADALIAHGTLDRERLIALPLAGNLLREYSLMGAPDHH